MCQIRMTHTKTPRSTLRPESDALSWREGVETGPTCAAPVLPSLSLRGVICSFAANEAEDRRPY